MHCPFIAPLHGSHGLSTQRAWRTFSSRSEGPKAGPRGRYLTSSIFICIKTLYLNGLYSWICGLFWSVFLQKSLKEWWYLLCLVICFFLPVKTECLHLRIQEYRISSTNQIKLRDTALSNHAAEQMHLALVLVCIWSVYCRWVCMLVWVGLGLYFIISTAERCS